jgi:tetratricopeptide (TPR) repeat protein
MKLKISMLYLNRAVIDIINKLFNDALNDLNIAFTYADSDIQIFSEQKAKILLNRSKVLFAIERKEEALKDINLAINIFEGLKEKNTLIEDEILMKAYTNYGIILSDIDENKRAIGYYNNAIIIGKKLKNEERYINDYEFYKTHFLLALSYGKVNSLDKEFEVYKELLETEDFEDSNEREMSLIYLSSLNNLISLLDEETRCIDKDFIVVKLDKLLNQINDDLNIEYLPIYFAVINYVTVYLKDKNLYEKAIKYQKRLLSISDMMDNDTEVKSIILKEIGDCFVKQNKFSDSLFYYSSSIDLIRRIDYRKLDLHKKLSEMLYNRSVIHLRKKLYQEAYDDAFESMNVTNYCLENKVLISTDFVVQRAKHLMALYSYAERLGILVH